MRRIAVAGGGVAGLSAVARLLEIAAVAGPDPLEIVFVAPLVPGEGSDGSGLGGKAMSRSFIGRYDAAHEGMDRHPFYGAAMPERGTIPHGYHVLWGYPNLRRLLVRGDEGPDLSGMLRPPGGSRMIASFQALLDDPSPGGPSIGLVGLCDPEVPETATREVTRALFRLRGTPFIHPLFALFELLFGVAAESPVSPLAFADLLFSTEVDLEMRLVLIAAALEARQTDPETATVLVDGVAKRLCDVEYDVWARAVMTNHVTEALSRLAGLPDKRHGGPLRAVLGTLIGGVRDLVREGTAVGRLIGVLLDGGEVAPPVPSGAQDEPHGVIADCHIVYEAVRDLLDAVPGALERLGTGRYPAWRTLHFRFAPDATFASPYSFDAAQAVRSLAFCFLDPVASRMWVADGARIQRLWLRLWENIREDAAALKHVTFTVIEGRVASTDTRADGRIGLWTGKTLGHGPRSAGKDLGYPHQAELRPPPRPGDVVDIGAFDAFIPTLPPALLADILPSAAARLAPLVPIATISTELVIWTAQPIVYAAAAREGLKNAAITGLEGPFCLLADYRCGLWSDAELDAQDPFGDRAFSGSILESCGGYHDLFATQDRRDAYGWPAEAKAAIAALLDAPAKFQAVAKRAWPHDESGRWRAKVADGTWTEAEMESDVAREDWFVASRWLVWGFLHQLACCEALGPHAVRQFRYYARLVDPRTCDRAALVQPSASLLNEVRWVVMRNANRRSRFFTPGVGDWRHRPFAGDPIVPRVFPAGDWTRNGLDVVCMEGACISALRAGDAAWSTATGRPVPTGVARPIPVLPPRSWYDASPDARTR